MHRGRFWQFVDFNAGVNAMMNEDISLLYPPRLSHNRIASFASLHNVIIIIIIIKWYLEA